jgi:uncharacterized cupredoxin-like copper-binding protein
MSRPLNPLRAAAVALASLSFVIAGCGAGAPALTFNPVAVAPTAAPSVAPSAETIQAPTIALSEWKIVTASSIKAGTVKFTITNAGTIPHELLVFKSDLPAAAYPTDPAGDIIEEGGGVSLTSDGENIDPAGTQIRSIKLAPGTYLFVCNIPGHFHSGMFSVVTVTE